MTAECRGCNTRVSDAYARVFSADGESVPGCPACSSLTERLYAIGDSDEIAGAGGESS